MNMAETSKLVEKVGGVELCSSIEQRQYMLPNGVLVRISKGTGGTTIRVVDSITCPDVTHD